MMKKVFLILLAGILLAAAPSAGAEYRNYQITVTEIDDLCASKLKVERLEEEENPEEED